jgi:phosphohistidine phosphatase
MKSLLILRHAKSSWKDETLPDQERPLNKRGKREAPQVGELIRREGLLPDHILCSTAKRARLTAELAAEAAGYDGEIETDRDLYGGGAAAYLGALAKLDDGYERVMIVGHNPDLEELLRGLTGKVEGLSTAALAWVQLPIEQWRALNRRTSGQLAGLWRPKDED